MKMHTFLIHSIYILFLYVCVFSICVYIALKDSNMMFLYIWPFDFGHHTVYMLTKHVEDNIHTLKRLP